MLDSSYIFALLVHFSLPKGRIVLSRDFNHGKAGYSMQGD